MQLVLTKQQNLLQQRNNILKLSKNEFFIDQDEANIKTNGTTTKAAAKMQLGLTIDDNESAKRRKQNILPKAAAKCKQNILKHK